MDEIRRRDVRVFLREFFNPSRFVLLIILTAFFAAGGNAVADTIGAIIVGLVTVAAYGFSSLGRSIPKRFISRRYAELWKGCDERLATFEDALKKLKKADFAEYSELPTTVRQLADSLYRALRRADIIFDEIATSEHNVSRSPNVPLVMPTDAQATELYRIADRNIAEYKANYSGLLAGVHRTEAQAAVFVTTLDTLRVKMLGYRLVGRNPSLSSNEFLHSIAEAKLQLDSIDKALDELELGHYPKTISVVQPDAAQSDDQPAQDLGLRPNLSSEPPPFPPHLRMNQTSEEDRL